MKQKKQKEKQTISEKEKKSQVDTAKKAEETRMTEKKEEILASTVLSKSSRDQAEKPSIGFNSAYIGYFLHSYWHIILLFFLAWLFAAYFICFSLQTPLQVNVLKQFELLSLKAEYPFEYTETIEPGTGENQYPADAQYAPVLERDEESVSETEEIFRNKIIALRNFSDSDKLDENTLRLQSTLKNDLAVNILLSCIREHLENGLINDELVNDLKNRPAVLSDEIIVFTNGTKIKRSFDSVLTLQEAKHQIEESFAKRANLEKILELDYFWQENLLQANLNFNEEKTIEENPALADKAISVVRKIKRGQDIISLNLSDDQKLLLKAYLQQGKTLSSDIKYLLKPRINRQTYLRLFLMSLFFIAYIFCLTRIRIAAAILSQRLSVSAVALLLHFVLTFMAFYIYSNYADYSTNSWSFAYLLCLLPAALVPSLLANLLGGRIAICSAALVSALLPLQIPALSLQYQLFHYSLFISLMGVALFQTAKQRRDFLKAALILSIALVFSQFIFAAEQNVIPKIFSMFSLRIVVFSFGNGFLVAILCMLLLPIFESVFGLVTLTTLLELNDSEHKLLKALKQKAPGTYQHSLTVATIAESAANEIQANALLARIMALFHDIGKLENPEYFAENSNPNNNPHDKLPAEVSSQIIIAHVADGMALADKYKLRKEIKAAIEQHHGNSLVSSFYEKAKAETKKAGKEAPDESLFRYPHPPPVQKEIVIVSLADACEAAVRAISSEAYKQTEVLKNAAEMIRKENMEGKSSEEILQKQRELLMNFEKERKGGFTCENIAKRIITIIDGKWNDNQFSKADITTSELEAIKRSFLRTFLDIYHFRPQYPDVRD